MAANKTEIPLLTLLTALKDAMEITSEVATGKALSNEVIDKAKLINEQFKNDFAGVLEK